MTDQENMLTAAQKAAWLKALRSGDYRQTHGMMESCGAFCCLGVLARTLGGVTRNVNASVNHTSGIGAYYSDLPMAYELQAQCITKNDRERLSFELIANWVEANVPVRA